jgi:hypothetical protein
MWTLRKTGYDQETETGTLLVSALTSWPNASFQKPGNCVAYNVSDESFDSSNYSLGRTSVFVYGRAKLLFTQSLTPSQSDSHLLAFHKPPNQIHISNLVSFHCTAVDPGEQLLNGSGGAARRFMTNTRCILIITYRD